ncbi:3-oxoacyl-ACP reductase [Edaphobacter acidisoli]|uniref:3-oxoacyl-ACP reductase n=1 Tax=Edaphobacter acidisoli TaxID=2040573 RepID=A0A916RHH3_9BACT|nr:SDR family NAD(P)-dependent oxidoreductase [Edaphobacter acidisoli]GGA57765.1 3-oxoacyl-ACP reductase [Edaphobacter acidisoli]
MTQFATYPSLKDRVVVISGGANGIGESIVEAFHQQQAKVWFLDIDRSAAESLIARLSDKPNTPKFVECDLTNIAALQQAAAEITSHHKSIDILINNAGNDTRHSVEEVTPDLWNKYLALNLHHQFFLTQALLPAIRQSGHGSIINMSSISWIIPGTNLAAYNTAKAGIVGLTRTLAHELGPDGIRVNCVLPGAIMTERQRRLWFTETYQTEILSRQALKRMIQPEEVSRLLLFLAADDSSAITNQSYIIDAGWI